MSIKGTLLSTVIPNPQVACNYIVKIPGVSDTGITCFATSLPIMDRDEVTINVSGQPVYLPSKMQVPGEWTCSFYESVGSLTLKRFEELRNSEVVDWQGTPVSYKLHDIYVYLLSLGVPTYCCTLKGAWIKSMKVTDLSAEGADTPVTITVTFRYQYCEYKNYEGILNSL